MSEEKKKRGRPKGSKNKPKESKTKEVSSVLSVIKREEKNSGRIPVKAGINTWVDDETVPQDDFDKKIIRSKPVELRPKATNKKIKCSICNREVEIPASLQVSNYYRCERCIGGK